MSGAVTRNKLLGAVMIGGVQGAVASSSGLAGVVSAGLLLVCLPTLLMVLLGSWFAGGRGVLAAPGDMACLLELVLLTTMAVCAWMVRTPIGFVAALSALGYLFGGLAVLYLEARTAAASAVGIWPTFASAWWEILFFTINLIDTTLGKALVFGTLATPFVIAQAWDAIAPLARPSRECQSAPHDPPGADGASASGRRAERPRLRLDDLAGMQPLKAQLREFAAPFVDYGRRGARPADVNGLLLSGPPGNGKTVFAEALAGELGLPFLKAGVQDLTSKWVNDSPNRVREVFAAAAASEPCLLFLDEFDAVGTRRGGGPDQPAEDVKVVDALLTEIDAIRQRHVVLVAATNHPDRLDEALVRPGRFDRKIEIALPDLEARVGILTALLARFRVPADTASVHAAAQLWDRRSAAFLESVAKRLRDDLARSGATTAQASHFKAAARAVSRREGAIPKTGTRLSQLTLPPSTMHDARSIVHRLRHWESLAERGGSPPKGVLLYGPPGTGKTNLVRAIALELGDWHVFEVRTADIQHDPRRFQDVIDTACEHRPAIVFIDEADDLLRDRSFSPTATATNEILKAMDGMMGVVPEVVFFAATNNQDAIDAAAKRGGRFSDKIFMDLLRGTDLEAFAAAELTRRPRLAIAPELTAQWIAQAVGAIGPADLIAALDKAANTALLDDAPRPVDRAGFAAACAAVTGQVGNTGGMC